jgi:hypothetical protein
VAASSRDSLAGAGWRCRAPGTYRDLLPEHGPAFSWLRPSVLWQSRNDILAGLADPTDADRRLWVAARRRAGVDPELRIDHSRLESVSFLLAGDTGEGDASQFVTVPPLVACGEGIHFMLIASDVLYPAGDVNQYLEKFYRPYKDVLAPIYALPGNHDWYDGLGGFMLHFCGETDPPRATAPARPLSREWLRRLLWRRARPTDTGVVGKGRELRGRPEQRAEQPGPYFTIDTGPVRIVGIDSGIRGSLDAEQGEWLRLVSRSSDKPKILITGKPIYVDGTHVPGAIAGTELTVDAIVRDREHNYVAAIGGDIHNYQRYPVDVVGGRTIQYIVAGGGGAFMHATHQIPKVDLQGVTEERFRCYPLRGDSLSLYSRLYDRRVAFGRGHLAIPPDEAAAIVSERLDIPPTRGGPAVEVSAASRRAGKIIFPLPGKRGLQRLVSEFLDWNDPPLFKSFLRLDATASEIRIRCFAATGCLEHERKPPVEDEVTIRLDAQGCVRP